MLECSVGCSLYFVPLVILLFTYIEKPYRPIQALIGKHPLRRWSLEALRRRLKRRKILTPLKTSYRPNKNVRQLLQGAGMQILPLCTLSKLAKSSENHVNACLPTKLIMYYYIIYTISISSFFMKIIFAYVS